MSFEFVIHTNPRYPSGIVPHTSYQQSSHLPARVHACAPHPTCIDIHPLFSVMEAGSLIAAYLGISRKASTQYFRIFNHDMGLALIACLEDKESLTFDQLQSYRGQLARRMMPSSLGDVIKFCPQLRSLDLSYSPITDEEIQDLLRNLSSITTLNLEGCDRLTDRSLSIIAFHCPQLTSLNLPGCYQITDRGVEALFQANRCTKLNKMNLSDCQITDYGVSIIAKNCPNLTFLSFANCPHISDEGLVTLSRGCPQLSTLVLAGLPLVTDAGLNNLFFRCRDLTRLNLAGCHQLTDESVVNLSLYCRGLTELDLTGCQISDASLQALSHGCSALTHVYFNDCVALTDDGVIAFARGCPELIHLDLTCCRRISDLSLIEISEKCRKLTYLNVSECLLVTDAGLQALSTGCSALSHLLLAGCDHITDRGINFISGQCPLIHLSLSGCLITDHALRFLGENSLELEQLELAGCPGITNMGLIYLRHCTQLTSLDLSECNIWDIGLVQLRECRHVQVLNISQCGAVTDTGLEILAGECKNLTHLSIGGCSFSWRALNALSINCPWIISIDLTGSEITSAMLHIIGKGFPQLSEVILTDCEFEQNAHELLHAIRSERPLLQIVQ